MSLSLTNVQQTLFDEMVKKAYQSKGFILRDTVRRRDNVEGNIVQFRKVGSITAEQYGFQSAVVHQDPNFNKVEVTLQAYRASTLVDDVEQFLYNFSERQEDAMLVAMALGRRSDQLIIDALNASGTTNAIVNGGTGLTYDKVRQVVRYFEQNAVPPEERHIAISAIGQQQIMNEDKFINSRFVDLRPVMTGGLDGNFVMGMKWHVIPTMSEGGLPSPSANIRSCFAWHKMSMGMGIGKQFSTRIDYLAHLDSHQILGKMFANAKAVDAVGIVKCDIDETA